MLHITDINQSYSYIDTDIPDMYQYIMKKLTFSVKNLIQLLELVLGMVIKGFIEYTIKN